MEKRIEHRYKDYEWLTIFIKKTKCGRKKGLLFKKDDEECEHLDCAIYAAGEDVECEKSHCSFITIISIISIIAGAVFDRSYIILDIIWILISVLIYVDIDNYNNDNNNNNNRRKRGLMELEEFKKKWTHKWYKSVYGFKKESIEIV